MEDDDEVSSALEAQLVLLGYWPSEAKEDEEFISVAWRPGFPGFLVGGDWNLCFFFHIVGMPSSQWTFIIFRGVQTTNQVPTGAVLGEDVLNHGFL